MKKEGRLAFALVLLLGLLLAWPAPASDFLRVGIDRIQPGETATLPIFLFDESYTALGEDQPTDLQIQSFSVSVRPDSSFVTSVAFTSAGVLDGLTPLTETTVASGNLTSWISAYDGAGEQIQFALDDYSLVGWLTVDVSAAAPIGTSIALELSPFLSAISSQGGTVMLNGANGGLDLEDGRITVDTAALFEDDFETGDTTAWFFVSP